ncbi:uroporphyrinogen decarboxylase [Candidatus Epulonipiscioides saccharophilum]|nr:uroporphyrinogen decarboxylase [Epulopiscium sp. SCG-B10WGA-EpuloB]
MTRREIVINALNHIETEVIPYHLDFTEQALDQLIEYTNDSYIEDKLGGYLYYKQYWGWPTEIPEKPGYFKDEFGVEWNRNGADKDIGLPDIYQIQDLGDHDYIFPKCDEARLRRECEEMTKDKVKDDRFIMYGFGFLMFERAWSIAGMEEVLCGMVAYPEETLDFFNKIGDYYAHLVDIALEYDFDGIYFGDDWGQQQGLIMGLKHWRTYIKPQMAKLYKRVKDKGLFVLQHSCGDCHELFEDLIEIGLDCYQTFQPEVYNIKETKEKYGDKLAFWGGISTQQVLPYVTPDEVKEEVDEIAEVLMPGGGFIAAPTHALAFDVPPENILAMVDAFKHLKRS